MTACFHLPSVTCENCERLAGSGKLTYVPPPSQVLLTASDDLKALYALVGAIGPRSESSAVSARRTSNETRNEHGN